MNNFQIMYGEYYYNPRVSFEGPEEQRSFNSYRRNFLVKPGGMLIGYRYPIPIAFSFLGSQSH